MLDLFSCYFINRKFKNVTLQISSRISSHKKILDLG